MEREIKFRARFNKIEEFEVIKETEKQLVYLDERGRECREAKITDWQSWHNSKEDAKEFMIGKKRKEIEQLNNRIDFLNKEINEICRL